MLIINPGTEGRDGATVENATAVVGQICADLSIPPEQIQRQPEKDDEADGFFSFVFDNGNGCRFDIEVPGDDPAQVTASKPFVSRRLYVDGSSWLYGYALNAIERCISGEE